VPALQNPTLHLNDAIVFNLCTLYELSCDNELQTQKKLTLKEVCRRFHLDDISDLYFRISGS